MIESTYIVTTAGNAQVYLIDCNNEKWVFLVSYDHVKDDFGFLCPCCMEESDHKAIMNAVKTVIDAGKAHDNEVIWCSNNGERPNPLLKFLYGNTLSRYPGLRQESFVGGLTESIPPEAKQSVREEALRQLAAGTIKNCP